MGKPPRKLDVACVISSSETSKPQRPKETREGGALSSFRSWEAAGSEFSYVGRNLWQEDCSWIFWCRLWAEERVSRKLLSKCIIREWEGSLPVYCFVTVSNSVVTCSVPTGPSSARVDPATASGFTGGLKKVCFMSRMGCGVSTQ